MGKIRVKSFGDQELEEKEKKLTAKRLEKKEQKNAAKKAEENPIEEVLPEAESETPEESTGKKISSYKAKTQADKKIRSKKYLEKIVSINPKETYSISEGIKLLDTVHMASFDETVELHINTNSQPISGQVTLPHGTGKKTRVAIFTDEILAEIEKGIVNFDILLAEPSMMPKLAKVARILGPKGLMPNPKNGTVTPKPEEAAKKFEGGAMNYKTEKAPIIHLIVGKLSFGPEKIEENIKAAIIAIKKNNISDITLKSTMSPGIKIQV